MHNFLRFHCVCTFFQVRYFSALLSEHDQNAIGSRARVMLAHLVTPRLLLHSCFEKVRCIFIPVVFQAQKFEFLFFRNCSLFLQIEFIHIMLIAQSQSSHVFTSEGRHSNNWRGLAIPRLESRRRVDGTTHRMDGRAFQQSQQLHQVVCENPRGRMETENNVS